MPSRSPLRPKSAAHLTRGEVAALIARLRPVGRRGSGAATYDPAAAREAARAAVAARCMRPEHDRQPLAAITRRPDGSLTLCTQCHRGGLVTE
jgi:hypothetical protein